MTLRLYLTSTATGSPFPTTSRLLSTTNNASEVTLGPGLFDSGLQGNTDSGQWNPSSAIADASNAAEIDNTGATLGTSRQGWLYDVSLTNQRLIHGTVTAQLRLNANVGTGNTGRIAMRLTIVRGVAGAWVTDQNLLTTAITGEASHSTGQNGWRANEGSVITVTNTPTNFSVTIATTLAQYEISQDQRLLFELGFCDANSTTDRVWRLDFNTANSFIEIPDLIAAPTFSPRRDWFSRYGLR